MNKPLTILLVAVSFCFLTKGLKAGPNILNAHDATGLPGENILIDIEIINENQFMAFQFDIPLPEDFGYVSGSFMLNPARKVDHHANVNILPGTNIFRVLAWSISNTNFVGSFGVIATFELTTPNQPGAYLLVFENAIISNSSGDNIITGTLPGTITLIGSGQWLTGDSNCDGVVNVIDIYTTIDYILGYDPQPFCFENADVNYDGIVDAIDLVAIINIILNGGFMCGVSSITDIDGNLYNTVLIGNQCWMKENLKTTKYRNGTSIENPTVNSDWQNNTTGAYAWYNNDIGWKDSYGALYNWHAVNNSNGLCPTGWHVPSDAEWTQLVDYVVSQGFPNNNVTNGAGNALKSCRQVNSPLGGYCNTTVHPRWNSHGTHHGFDEFGFSGLPGGYRWTDGGFNGVGYSGTWWIKDIVWGKTMSSYSGGVEWFDCNESFGFSVRCFRDIVRSEFD